MLDVYTGYRGIRMGLRLCSNERNVRLSHSTLETVSTTHPVSLFSCSIMS